jgi:hypothetical protein
MGNYQEYLEITTKIGCPVNCMKYCPQDLIIKKHAGEEHLLTLDAFKTYISTLPAGLPVNFSGICEPFSNPETIDLIEFAAQNHPVRVFTTLVGLKPEQAERLVRTKFQVFQVHMPDVKGNAKIPITDEYLKTLGIIMGNVDNILFMNMGGLFETNNNENMHRDPEHTKRRSGRIFCGLHEKPGMGLMPNGDVYFCCMSRGLTDKVGSLKDNTYPELVGKYRELSRKLQRDEQSTCHVCSLAIPYHVYKLAKIKDIVRDYYGIDSEQYRPK